jgi:hypothetical protein
MADETIAASSGSTVLATLSASVSPNSTASPVRSKIGKLSDLTRNRSFRRIAAFTRPDVKHGDRDESAAAVRVVLMCGPDSALHREGTNLVYVE